MFNIISNQVFYTLGLYDIWNMLDNQQKETLTEAINIGIDEGIKQVKVEPEVIVKLAEVIENKKIQINTSLDEYLSEADYVTTGRLEILKLIAENECKICDEILGDVKSKFSE